MHEMNNEKFGQLISQIRKEKGWTQKELAEKIGISDKAVSKWERGLSVPNVDMLLPLAEVLGITVTELLRGEKLSEDAVLHKDEVEKLVTHSVDMTIYEHELQREGRKRWKMVYIIALGVVAVELFLLSRTGMSFAEMFGNNIMTLEILMFIFGGWFCFFVKEKLPTYYDENKISYVTDRVFRMHMPGIHFNNSNWPHIIEALRVWTMAVAMIYPVIVYGLISISVRLNFALQDLVVILMFPFAFSVLVIVYVVGKKYE